MCVAEKIKRLDHFLFSRKSCLQLYGRQILINDLVGIFKAGILHDNSCFETGEASVIPPVDTIWKRSNSHNLQKKKRLKGATQTRLI